MASDATLRALAEAATPGPWQWYGWRGQHIQLSTVGRGVATVMGFARYGMQGAQPVFFERTADDRECSMITGRYRKGDDLIVQEVEYRGTIDHLDNADAKWIAAASPDVVLALLDRIDRLEAAASPEGSTEP